VLILVRHGRTRANAAGLLLGRSDPDLDDEGRRQAGALAAVVAGGPPPATVGRVVASPLARAVATAACFGLPVEVDGRWAEIDYGDWEGRPVGGVTAEEWSRWRGDPGFAPPGGESLADLHRRVVAACDELAGAAAAGDVVVVSHVSPIKAAVAWALGVGVELAWRCHLDPASVTRVEVGARGPVLRSFNERGAHLRVPPR
jgi:broad specificity phosphatase PhoE